MLNGRVSFINLILRNGNDQFYQPNTLSTYFSSAEFVGALC